MVEDNIELSDDFTEAHVVGTTTETISDLKQKLAVAEVRDFIAEFIHKGDDIFDVDKQDALDFVQISTEDSSDWLKSITHQALYKLELDTSQAHIDATYESALQSATAQIQTVANRLQQKEGLTALTN